MATVKVTVVKPVTVAIDVTFHIAGLTGEARKIALLVIGFLSGEIPERPISGFGCKAFYSPAQWRERGEEYGRESKLILCYDGGDLREYCNWDYQNYRAIDRLSAHLAKHGYYVEQCTSWYSAVYPI